MASTSSTSSPLASFPPLIPTISSSSDDYESLINSITLSSSSAGPPTHLPLAPHPYPAEMEDNSDNDADMEPAAGSPILPPGLGGSGGSVGAAEQLPESMETPSRILPLVPIPTVSPAADSISFAFPDPSAAATGELSVLLKSLPEEAEADIVIANDSSYVETSSAPWAMELKRRYDSLYGVNVTVRSPYAITAFVGQHGQKRYRIGHRELSAPGASAAAAEDILVLSNLSKQSKSPPPQTSPQSSKAGTAVGGGRSKSNSTRSTSGSIAKPASKVSLTNSETSPRPSHQSQSFSRASKSSKSGKRHSRGRISINALLGSGSGPSTGAVGNTPRKLKKPRSNPDLSLSSPSVDLGYGYSGYGYTYGYGQLPPSSFNYNNPTVPGPGGRMHSLSVTATDMPHVLGIDPANPPSIPASSLFPNPAHLTIPMTKAPERKGDSFGEIMGWRNHPNPAFRSPSSTSGASNGFSTSAPSSSYVAHSTHSLFFEPQTGNRDSNANEYPHASPASNGANSSNGSASGPNFIPRPFGSDVHFETPAILRSSHSQHPSRDKLSKMNGFFRSSSRSGSGSGSGDFGSNGSSSEHDFEPESEDPDSEPESDYGRFLKVRYPARTNRHLREMQSFESGLTATPIPPATPTLAGASASSSSNALRASTLSTTRLEVDLGGGINLNIGEIVNIVDLALNENAGQKVIERQRSAIKLVDRDRERERETTMKANKLETIEAESTSSPDGSHSTNTTVFSSAQVPPDTSYSLVEVGSIDGETTLSSSSRPTLPHHSSTSDLSLSREYTSHSANDGNTFGVHLDHGVNLIQIPNQTERSTPQTPQTPRVQMFSPPGLPPRLAKFSAYSTEVFDVLQNSRGLPRLDLLDVHDDDDDAAAAADDDDNVIDHDVNKPSSPDSSSARRTLLPETVPVKLSLSQDGSAAPKDDPRFVIWGKVSENNGTGSGDTLSVSHESSASTNSSIGIGHGGKGKSRALDLQSNHGHSVHGSSTVNVNLGSDDGSEKRMLLAATIERWLAQLTSDLDYDELLNFFLTYRTYISALDLARLLMSRFCWALGSSASVSSPPHTSTSFNSFSPPTTASTSSTATVRPEISSFTTTPTSTIPNISTDVNHDDVVRRIVRVRTFVAFKYWLITFFTVDFVPHRELRLLVANLFNDMAKELGELRREVELAGQEMGKEGRDMKEREIGMSKGAIVDGMSIMKKLKNVAKDCKKLYTHNNNNRSQNPNKDGQPQTISRKSISGNIRSEPNTIEKENLFGEKFAEATRKLSAASAPTILDANDSDVDLDFIDEPSSSPYSGVYGKTPVINFHLGGASTLNLSTAISPPGPGSIPLSSFSILQRTDHAPGPEMFSGSMYGSSINSNTTPIPHNALSRVLVKTLGRLGRWKRVLNSGGVAHGVNMHRSMTTGGLGKPYVGGGLTRIATACADVSAFDVELTVDSSDLLSSSGGVESYLRLVEGRSPQVPRSHSHAPPVAVNPVKPLPNAEPRPSLPTTPTLPDTAVTNAVPAIPTSLDSGSKTSNRHSFANSPQESHPSASPKTALDEVDVHLQTFDSSSEPSVTRNRDSFAETVSDYGAVINVHEVRDSAALSPEMNEEHALHNHDSHLTRRSSRTSSTDSFGEPLSASRASARFPEFTSPWQFDVVTLDELSDDSSDERGTRTRGDDPPAAPPGLRRPSRRLPRRREFEFLERPETVSSMGIISRSSIVSASSASGQSTASHTSSSSAAGGLGAGIQQWQMNALKDSLMDDEEPGDVDDALKRLEGQINPQKQMEKVSKVNGWVKTIRERLAAGDYSDEEPMYSDDDDDDNVEVDQHEGPASSSSQNVQSAELASATTPASTDTPLPDVESSATSTPVVEQVDKVTSPARSTDAKPVVEDAVPLEILQSRLSSELPPPVTSTFVDRSIRPKAVHRSFVLLFKAEDLAQHFAMIDRELFMTIKFEELLLDDWMFCEEVNTLDWAQFLKDRARWKAESRLPDKTSALGAVRARFNLMVNFTMSEVVLTNQAERPYVFSKFLRIAWKSYQHNSFNTLVAIVTGLQSSWVVRAMRKSMNKLSIGDKQILTNLKLFTSRKDNFKLIRCAVDAINDAKPFETTSHASSVVSAADSANDQPTPSACIPFVGTYLSQLYQYNQLPVLVDPTAPNEVVTFDPVSSDFSPPAHPQVFLTLAPLPSTMHLELLINVHRQRLIAAVIKSLVAGQHLASRVQFPIDKKLFHKCLRIRGLDSNTLQRALALNAP